MRFKWLYIAGFVVIIAMPLVLFVVGMRPEAIENRPLAPLPSLAPGDLAQSDTYAGLSDYVLDRLPGRDAAVELDATIDYRLLGQSPSSDVLIGSDGWIFLTDAVDGDCITAEQARDLVDEIERASLIVTATGRRLVFAVAPSKASIYPDRLGSEADRAVCSAKTRDLVRSELDRRPGVAVTAWDELAAAADERQVFHRHDTHWNAWGASVFAPLVVDAVEPGRPGDSTVSQTGAVAYEGDLTRLLGIPWSEDAPVVVTERQGLAEAERTVIDLKHDHTATATNRPLSDTPLVESPTLLLHDSFGISVVKHLTPFFADFTAVKETHIDYEYVRPLLEHADTILVEKVERFLVSFVLEERMSSKMVSAFLEELDPVEAAVTVSTSLVEVEAPPPAGPNQLVYLVAVTDRTLGAVFEVWTSATGPDEVRKLGGFRERVAWQMPPGTGSVELHGFPPDVGIDAFYVTIDGPPSAGD